MDPVVGYGALGLAEGAANYLGGAGERAEKRWGFGQRKDLYDMLRWHTYGKQGDVIDAARMNELLAQFRMANKPTQNRIAAGAGRFSGMRSPETWKMMSEQAVGPESEFMGDLALKNIQMTQDRDQNILRLMAMLSSGG